MNKNVEVPIDWLIQLLKLTDETLVFHEGILQQVEPWKAAQLKGYVASIGEILPDFKEQQS